MSPVFGASTEFLNEQVEVRTFLTPCIKPPVTHEIENISMQVPVVTEKILQSAKKKEKNKKKKMKNGTSIVENEAANSSKKSSIENSHGSRKKHRLFFRCFQGNDSP